MPDPPLADVRNPTMGDTLGWGTQTHAFNVRVTPIEQDSTARPKA